MPENSAPRDKVMTVAAIQADPWNVINMRLPENPDRALLEAGRTAALACKEQFKPQLWAPTDSESEDNFIEARWRWIGQCIEILEEELAKLPPSDWPTFDELHELAQEGRGFVRDLFGRGREPEPERDRDNEPDIGR